MNTAQFKALWAGRFGFSRLFGIFLIVAMLFSVTGNVQATLLAPNTILAPTPAEPDPIGANLIATTGAVPFTTSGPFLYSGTLTSSVFNNDITNPWGPNALTFTYLLTNDAGSIDALERLTVINFETFLTDASYQAPAAGTIPLYVDRSVSGGTIGFSFVQAPLGFGKVAPGTSAALLVIQTNATSYFSSLASVINGKTTEVPSYSPNPLIPEPSSIAFLAAGGFAALAIIRRRKAANTNS